MMRDAQRQVLGESAVPKLSPSGKYTAPPVNPKGSLVFKDGAAHFQAPLRSSLVTAVAGVAGQMLVQPLADVISDNIINPLIGAALDRDIPKMDEIRRLEALQIQNSRKDENMIKYICFFHIFLCFPSYFHLFLCKFQQK